MAYESIRAINHLTNHGAAIPAPVLYRVLGEMKGVGSLMPQALDQLGQGLRSSLTQFDVYDHSGDPATNVARAQGLLEEAAAAARQLGALLEQAQSAIADQGYRGTDEP